LSGSPNNQKAHRGSSTGAEPRKWLFLNFCSIDKLYGLGNFEGPMLSSLQDGSQCDFFHWQASYAVLLIKDGVVSGDHCLELLMVALNDHGKAVESLTNSIREMKKKLSDLELVMEELDNVKKSMKAAMVEIEENKKSIAALKLMENEMQMLKGSTKVKPRNMALCFLLLALIGWFVMGQMN
jgi:hypothetical protein